MIGNDIVDLSDPETRRGGQHPRFDERVFAVSERAAIARSSDPHRTRWALWAVKESAYKAWRRIRPETVFSPRRFVVDLDPQGNGSVTHRNRRASARVETAGDCVHAVVEVDSTSAWTLWAAQPVRNPTTSPLASHADANRSERVRALALDCIADRLEIDRRDLGIGRIGRIPTLLHRDAPTAALLSLSHHGGFVGFACRFPTAPAGIGREVIAPQSGATP